MMVIKRYINELIFVIGNIAIILLNDLVTNKIICLPIVIVSVILVIYSLYKGKIIKGNIRNVIIGSYILALTIYLICIIGAF